MLQQYSFFFVCVDLSLELCLHNEPVNLYWVGPDLKHPGSNTLV